MRKAITILVVLWTCLSARYANAEDEAALRYTIKMLVVSEDTGNLLTLSKTAWAKEVGVDPTAYELAAELAYAESKKKNVDVAKLIALVRILGSSHSPKYSELLRSIGAQVRLARIQAEVTKALAKLPATASLSYIPGRQGHQRKETL